VLLVVSGCAPDPFVGSFNFVLTGSDTTTAPSMSTSTPMGTGTLAITHGLTADYVVVIAQSDAPSCTLAGTKVANKPLAMTLRADQKCQFTNPLGTSTATLTTGDLTLDSSTQNQATLAVAYSYSGTTLLSINFAGTGRRAFTGPRF
jgi:hypothetical protein